jgi:hypothetical protein
VEKIEEVIKGLFNGIHWTKIFPEAPNYVEEADGWFARMVGNRLLDGLEASSPYLTTLLIVAFAFWMMITGDLHKGIRNMLMSFWIGIAVKLILF